MKYNNKTITKRKDGRWWTRYYQNNKQISIYGKTQKEVLQKLKTIINQKQLPAPLHQPKTLFNWIEEWLEVYKKPNLKEKSYKSLLSCFNLHIKKNIKDIELSKLTGIQINFALNKIKSSRMKKYTYDLYHESLKKAYLNRLTNENIADFIEKVIHRRKEGSALTKEQRIIFFKMTDKIKHGAIFKFLLLSGCRKHGALTLKPQQLDFENKTIHLTETKSINADRYIPMTNQLENILKCLDLKKEFVFNISESTLKREKEQLEKLCNFNFAIKDLRTTFATICAENKINDKIISKWMGHGNTSTTKKYYIKTLNDFELQESKKINSVFDTYFDTYKN